LWRIPFSCLVHMEKCSVCSMSRSASLCITVMFYRNLRRIRWTWCREIPTQLPRRCCSCRFTRASLLRYCVDGLHVPGVRTLGARGLFLPDSDNPPPLPGVPTASATACLLTGAHLVPKSARKRRCYTDTVRFCVKHTTCAFCSKASRCVPFYKMACCNRIVGRTVFWGQIQ
jgi:hypothetical protein